MPAELAQEVSTEPAADPHGLTITGPSLDEIFERIDGQIVRNVPMD
jgi:hypothetical protein